MATLIEMVVVCFLIFWGSGFLKTDAAYRRRIAAFFARLETPVPVVKRDKAHDMHGVLQRLYAVAMASTGSLFILLGLPSVGDYSGRMALAVGALCLVAAFFLFRNNRGAIPKPEPARHQVPVEK